MSQVSHQPRIQEESSTSRMPKRKKRAKDDASEDAEGTFSPTRCQVANPGGPHHYPKSKKKKIERAAEMEDSDEWQTCKESWIELTPLISRFKSQRVWMPFWYDGECAKHLRACGFKHVYHKKRDFFALAKDPGFLSQVDVIIDNPPYTGEEIKTKVLKALRDTEKPFAMLLPLTVLHSKLLRDVLDVKYVQAIIPRRVLVRKTAP